MAPAIDSSEITAIIKSKIENYSELFIRHTRYYGSVACFHGEMCLKLPFCHIVCDNSVRNLTFSPILVYGIHNVYILLD